MRVLSALAVTLGLLVLAALALRPWEATAQPPYGYMRLLDGAHNQAARVNHEGAVSVFGALNIAHLSSVTHIAAAGPIPVVASPQGALWAVAAHQAGQSGAIWRIDHVTSVLHFSAAGTPWGVNMALAVRCVNTGATAFEACGGGAGGGDAVNVFHQSTIRHISSVTHVVIVGPTGPAVSSWNVAHISAAVHLAGGVTDQVNSALRVTGVTVFTVMGAIDHISSQLHVANTGFANALATRCVNTGGTAFEACGGAGDGVNVFHQSTIRHISSVTHVGGTISLVSQAGTYVSLTGTQLDVNCTGCAAASVVAVSHISAAVHIGGTIQGAQFHIQGLGLPGQSHGGVLSIQGVGGGNALAVSQSGTWTVQPGNTANTAAWIVNANQGTAGNFLWPVAAHIQTGAVQQGAAGSQVWPVAAHQGGVWTLAHVSSVTHTSGTVVAFGRQATDLVGLAHAALRVIVPVTSKTLLRHIGVFPSTSYFIAATGGKRIYVYAYGLQSRAASVTAQLVDDKTAHVTLRWAFNAREGVNQAVTPPAYLFATSPGNALQMHVTAGTVDADVSYWVEE